MDKVLKFFQILNQVVWILVGVATLLSIYWFITHNPLGDITKQLAPLIGGAPPAQSQQSSGMQIPDGFKNNPQVQKLLQQYSK